MCVHLYVTCICMCDRALIRYRESFKKQACGCRLLPSRWDFGLCSPGGKYHHRQWILEREDLVWSWPTFPPPTQSTETIMALSDNDCIVYQIYPQSNPSGVSPQNAFQEPKCDLIQGREENSKQIRIHNLKTIQCRCPLLQAMLLAVIHPTCK